MDPKPIMEELLLCLEQKRPAALVTVVSASGSTPSRPGAKMLVYEDGSILGTVGGGALEARLIEEAGRVIKKGEPFYASYSLNSNDAAGLGMVCGGEVSAFIDCFVTGPEMVIVGAGHISQDLARMAKMLDFKVTIIDDREDYACEERFPEADQLIAADIGSALDNLKITENTYLALLSRGHKHDQVALEKVACSDAAYIGMIGSRSKIKTVFENLRQKGFADSDLEKVHAPIGLDLGGNTPAEIALSIAAEIVKVRYSRGDVDREQG